MQGAGETGQAEAYMNSRIMRNFRVKGSIAQYLGEFVADQSEGGFIQGTQWLVWKFESDTTLSDAMQASKPSQAMLYDPSCLITITYTNRVLQLY